MRAHRLLACVSLLAACGGGSTGGDVGTAPSIATQPVAQMVTAPASATFTVSAQGSAPLRYQWLKNGGAISGATDAAYTFPAATAADDGARFSVLVTNGAGAALSNVAVLTVTATPVA